MKKIIISAALILCGVFNTFAIDPEYCLNQGNAYFSEKNYSEARPYLEYVIAHGTFYAQDVYEEALQKLFVSYNNTNCYEEMESLYNKLSPNDFTPEVFSLLTSLESDAKLLIDVKSLAQKVKEQPDLAGQIQEELLTYEKAVNGSNIKNLNDIYYSALTYAASLQQNWSAVQIYGQFISSPDLTTVYTIASADYKLFAYKDAVTILEKNEQTKKDYNCQMLKAGSFCALKEYKKACDIYSAYDSRLDSDNRLEYSKALYQLSKYEEASKQALQANKSLSYYIAGLSQYNLKKYQAAYEYLAKFAADKNSSENLKGNAFYYQGLAAYKRGIYADASTCFSNAQKKLTDTEKLKACYENGSKAALLLGKYGPAATEAKKLTEITTGKEKEAAIIYLSEIYIDDKKYDQAVKTLEPYVKGKDNFAVTCLFKIATVYEKSGSLNQADKMYQYICTYFKGTDQAEEAMYRSGEIFYSAQNYAEAESRFKNYINNYVNGRYAAGAYYYSGDCTLRLKDYTRSILQNQTLVSNYPDSIYGYGAYSNLLTAYYVQENYAAALNTARTMVRKYKEQAVADDIGTRVAELERIVSGTDRRIVEKYSEYEKLGKTESKAGRIKGSELVQLYNEYGSEDEAINLAVALLQSQRADDGEEIPYIAANAELAAKGLAKWGEAQKAGELYLKAAENYRGSGNAEKAAACLYSATDAFVTAGLAGDAKNTAKLLIQLYPDSRYAKKVNSLLN